MNITIYKTEQCAYCIPTVKYIKNHGIEPIVIDITYNTQLANEVSKAVHSMQVPVVTTANSLDEINHDNYFTGWQLSKLNQFIKQVKGE